MKTISVKWLNEHNACKNQVTTFRKHFGSGDVRITRARLVRAARLRLDISWLAWRILPTPAWSKYQEAVLPPWKKYHEATELALQKYWKELKKYLGEAAHALADILELK